MRTRISVALVLSVIVIGVVRGQLARSAGPGPILRASVRDDAARKHNLSSLPSVHLRLRVDENLAGFEGEEELRWTNTTGASLNELVFHLYPNSAFLSERGAANMTVSEVTVNGARATRFVVERAELRVPLARPLTNGATATVGLKFRSKVPELFTVRSDSPTSLLRDLLRSLLKQDTNYGIFGVGDRVLNLGHWFPMLAHHDGKQWDSEDPTGLGDVANFDAANYEVTIDAPRSARVITSGTEQSNSVSGARRTARFFAGASRDFAVQMSARYEMATRVVDSVTVNSHYLSGHQPAGARALEVAAKSLAFFNKTFGAYPYKELDVVEAPLASIVGGMEHPGLITINTMLYDMGGLKMAKTGDAEVDAAMAHFDGMTDRMMAFVIAHEVAHQWWNAVVGSDSKKHPFLDEALANHSARLCLAAIASPQAADEQAFLNIELTYRLHRLMGGRDRAVDLPAKAYAGTTEYAAIVYGKGALFFAALQEQMGNERFIRMLQKYYERHQFGIAEPVDLLTAAREASANPAQTSALFDRWLNGAHGDQDIGPLRLHAIFETLIAPMLAKNAPEANFLREVTRSLDGLLKDAREGKADVIDQLLGELDAALSGKPTKTQSNLGGLMKAFEQLLKGLDGKSE